MLSGTDYDLYRFNQSAAQVEWENYKNEEITDFNLVNGQGYLYANTEDANIIFKGEFNEDETKSVDLAFDANAYLAGWNLVGNPFPVNAFADKSYFVVNEDGTGLEPVAVSSETPIPACTGVMVKADALGESVTFSKTNGASSKVGRLYISIAKASTRGKIVQDKAIVSFNAEDRLEKFVFGQKDAQISIPQGNKDYAITVANMQDEIPLNFKATKDGLYTLSVSLDHVELEYLHLIENMTGVNVDLLATPSYTFESKASDYASRFRLVFSAYEVTDGNIDNFAFFSNGSFVVSNEGEATLQVIDVNGRILKNETINGSASINANAAPGVYLLRLASGNNVKVQKVVVR